jgi:sigma-B regulation protein RsbU (phosphoserine phosphatase)
VIGSQSSAGAAALAREFKPDLVILDIRMPELDGFELMVRLKADHPDVDIIMMTGSLDDLDQKLIRAIRGHAFYFIQKPFDREVLQTLVERCLELRWRRQENRRHVDRLERELGDARAFQRGLLPVADMVLERVSVCSRYVPCSELGGDLCDYVAIDSERVALLVADVMGHGVSAAMLTGVVKSAFRAAEADDYEPSAVVERLRRSMAAFGPERFVTLIAGVLDIGEGCLRFVNAGHPSGLLRAEGGELLRLASTGPLISPALPGCTWEQRSIPVGPGALLLLYTDGITDALSSGEDSGEEPILAAARQHPRGGAPLLDAILSRIRERIHGRPQADDLTLLTATMLRRR